MIIAAFSYAAELALVVPIMLVWPAARQPSPWIAAAWGLLTAMGFEYGPLLLQAGTIFQFGPFEATLAAAGAASGLVYAVAVPKRRYSSI